MTRSFAEALLCVCVLATASCAGDANVSADRVDGGPPTLDAGSEGRAGAVPGAEGIGDDEADGDKEAGSIEDSAAEDGDDALTGSREDVDGRSGTDDGRAPRHGGTLRVAVEAEGDGINPAANNFAAPAYVMALPVIEPLVYWDAGGGWTPYLAEEVTKMGDSSSWQLKVRENVLFHDGSELDADDVIATFEAQYDDPIISRAVRPIYDPSEPIAKIDEHTVQYNLRADHARYPALLTGQLGMVLPSEWVARARRDPSLNQAPVGTGPFTVEKRVIDEVTVLRRNTEYWAADTVEVYLDAIEVYPVTESSDAIDLLVSGEIDAMITSAAEAIVALRETDGVYTIENTKSGDGLHNAEHVGGAFRRHARTPGDRPRNPPGSVSSSWWAGESPLLRTRSSTQMSSGTTRTWNSRRTCRTWQRRSCGAIAPTTRTTVTAAGSTQSSNTRAHPCHINGQPIS